MKSLIYLSLIFLLSMCKPYENLVLPKKDFTGTDLKTDGYFYTFTNDDVGYGYEGKIYDSFILYRNGIYHRVGSGSYNPDLAIGENLKISDSNINRRVASEKDYINTQIGWGVFKVTGSQIVIERWVTASGGGTYPTQMLKGEIKNDTTIHFHTLIGAPPVNYNSKKKVLTIDETYHFRQFSPKPDSTNNFIK